MTLPSPTSPFHPLPLSNITLPSTPLTTAALAFVTSNTRPSTVNHCLRSAAFALLLASRLPKFSTAALDIELIVVSVLLHDMGWATSTELLSTDRRFEVDGTDVARGWIEGFFSGEEGKEGGEKGKAWDKHRTQLLWDAIALHTTTSIAMYKEGEVAVAHMGISADFWGVYLGTEPGSQGMSSCHVCSSCCWALGVVGSMMTDWNRTRHVDLRRRVQGDCHGLSARGVQGGYGADYVRALQDQAGDDV